MEIEQALARAKVNKGSWQVSVIGVGGAGSRVVHFLASQRQYPQIQFLAVHYDPAILTTLDSVVKNIQIGVHANNLGCFGHAEISLEELAGIDAVVKQPGVAVILVGLGWTCGNANAPVIAGHLSALGMLTMAVAWLPFHFERERAMRRALEGLEKLKEAAAPVVAIPLQQILDDDPRSGTLTLCQAFAAADRQVLQAVKPILDRI